MPPTKKYRSGSIFGSPDVYTRADYEEYRKQQGWDTKQGGGSHSGWTPKGRELLAGVSSLLRPKMKPTGGFAGPVARPNPMGGGMDPLGQANTIRAMMQMIKRGRR